MPLVDRFETANLQSSGDQQPLALALDVAGVRVRLCFSHLWDREAFLFCSRHWSAFLNETGDTNRIADVEIVLAPAPGEFRERTHAAWNEREPFQHEVVDERGRWLFHRDFTALWAGDIFFTWLPQPTEEFTDALDNLLTIALKAVTDQRSIFLLHASVVEHEKKAVVFFGPSGIGKTTVAQLSVSFGYRVMSSDQVYLGLGVEGSSPWVAASPTRNPDISRDRKVWATEQMPVKALFALKRLGHFEVLALDQGEMTRRLFMELFCSSTESETAHFRHALGFASRLASLTNATSSLTQRALSYPREFNFWPRLKEMGYI